jgi:hypothetical protein
MSPATTQSEISSDLTKLSFLTNLLFGSEKDQNTL